MHRERERRQRERAREDDMYRERTSERTREREHSLSVHLYIYILTYMHIEREDRERNRERENEIDSVLPCGLPAICACRCVGARHVSVHQAPHHGRRDICMHTSIERENTEREGERGWYIERKRARERERERAFLVGSPIYIYLHTCI